MRIWYVYRWLDLDTLIGEPAHYLVDQVHWCRQCLAPPQAILVLFQKNSDLCSIKDSFGGGSIRMQSVSILVSTCPHPIVPFAKRSRRFSSSGEWASRFQIFDCDNSQPVWDKTHLRAEHTPASNVPRNLMLEYSQFGSEIASTIQIWPGIVEFVQLGINRLVLAHGSWP